MSNDFRPEYEPWAFETPIKATDYNEPIADSGQSLGDFLQAENERLRAALAELDRDKLAELASFHRLGAVRYGMVNEADYAFADDILTLTAATP